MLVRIPCWMIWRSFKTWVYVINKQGRQTHHTHCLRFRSDFGSFILWLIDFDFIFLFFKRHTLIKFEWFIFLWFYNNFIWICNKSLNITAHRKISWSFRRIFFFWKFSWNYFFWHYLNFHLLYLSYRSYNYFFFDLWLLYWLTKHFRKWLRM